MDLHGTDLSRSQVGERNWTPWRVFRPRIHIAKWDVSAAFDTIKQWKLVEIVTQLLQEDEYLVHRCASIQTTAGRTRKRFHRHAMPACIILWFLDCHPLICRDVAHGRWTSDEFPQWTDYAAEKSQTTQHAIFVDTVAHLIEERQALVALLKKHIESNTVLIGSRLYTQSLGIPQGSILSTLLCSLFYGELETTQELIPSPQSETVRWPSPTPS